MHYRLLYFDEVENDVKVAITWYREQKEGLELAFLKSVERVLLNIQEFPKIYAVRYRNVRIARTRTFPFNVHFYSNEKKKIVVVIAIVHNKRNQKSVKSRKK